MKKLALKVQTPPRPACAALPLPLALHSMVSGIAVGLCWAGAELERQARWVARAPGYACGGGGGSQVIACNLSREEILGLKKMFKEMDKDGSGAITYQELRVGMKKLWQQHARGVPAADHGGGQCTPQPPCLLCSLQSCVPD